MDDAEFCRRHRRAIVDDRVSGARQLARQALDSLAEFAGSCSATEPAALREALLSFAEDLQYARPSMAPIHNLVQRWADAVTDIEAQTAREFRHEAARLAQALSDRSIQAVDEVAAAAAGLIRPGSTIITHSLSTTVQATFRALLRHEPRAIVTESRPGLEGRAHARALDRLGIPVSFITDAQAGHFCARADIALVGADTVLGDGAVVNKAGTYLLALAARDQGIPFHVCCESFKQVPFATTSFELESLDPAEMEPPRGRHITTYNVYFDITPARLVDAWIHETGVRYAGDAAASPDPAEPT